MLIDERNDVRRTSATRVLAQDDVAEIVRRLGRDVVMDRVIARLEQAFAAFGAGDSDTTPAREGFVRGSDRSSVLEWMPHRQPGRAITLKAVAYTPANPVARGLPTILSTIARFDDITGRLDLLCDGVLLTAIRTGAASAVASRLLADPDSRVLGLIGAGAQAVTQVHALSRVLPLTDVLVYDTDAARAESLRERVAFTGLRVRVADPHTVATQAQVICTATSVARGAGPVLPDSPVRPDVHINAVGADLPGKVELPVELLRRASLVCADHVAQARREGECQQLDEADLGPTLGLLCANPALAAPHRGGITVFDSTGFALEDHIAVDVFAEIAEEEGIGTSTRIEHIPEDCVDPYSLPPAPRAGLPTAEPVLAGASGPSDPERR
jgi:ornithine cyclodeaminase/alanine dehydrogenase-like protein (mu-crystallin family)